MSKHLSEEREELSRIVKSLDVQGVHQRDFSLKINDNYTGEGYDTISLMRWVPKLQRLEIISEDASNISVIIYDVDTTLIIASDDAVIANEDKDEDENEASLSEDKIIATLGSTFRIYFHYDGEISLSEKQADVIGRTRCLFDIWPYWREFVAQACFRSNLPPINFPPFNAEVAAQKHS